MSARGRLFVLADNAQLVALAEPLVAAEEPGHEEVEDAPELREAVLHRRTREREPQTGAQALHGAGGLGGVVLDVLGLVEHHHAPIDAGELRAIDAHAIVGGHDHAGLAARTGQQRLAVRARSLQSDHRHIGSEAGELVGPVEHEGGGADHEHGAGQPLGVTQALHQGYHLQRLAETHLIGQDAAETERCQTRQPAEALHLVGPQRTRKGSGRLRRRGRPVQTTQVVFEGAVAHGIAILPI